MKRFSKCVGAMLVLMATSVSAQQYYIVKEGRPQADIVIADAAPPMVRLAAEDLQTYIAKMTGATLPIVTEAAAAVHVYVGKSSYTQSLGIDVANLEHDAFTIKSGDNWLALVGRDREFEPKEPHINHIGEFPRVNAEWDKLSGGHFGHPHQNLYKQYSRELDIWEHDGRGSFNAVTHFLRSQGVRWYLPDPLGEIVPQHASIELPQVDQIVRPDFAVRFAHQLYRHFASKPTATRDEILWQLRMGFSNGHEVVGLDFPTHGINYAHSRQEVRDAHPEYYLLLNGQREIFAGNVDRPGLTYDFEDVGRPCLSSEGLLQNNVRFLRAVFDVYGEQAFSVMPKDGYGTLCACELCKGKGSPQLGWYGKLSDYVWTYVDRVGREIIKTHPDRKIHCFAYSAYRQPPANIDTLSPNIIVAIAQGRAYFQDDQVREEMLETRKAWLAKMPEGSKQLLIGDYYLHANPTSAYMGLPAFFPHIVAEDLKSLKGISVGEFIEVYRNWGIIDLAVNHLNLYVTARYWWDADQDIDAMLEEYYTLYYGPARAEMKAFIEYCEPNYDDMRKDADKITAALTLLDAAVAKAPADSIYAKRIALIVEFVEPMKQRRDQLQIARSDTPVVRTAKENQKTIVLDGKFDDPCWAGVEVHRLKNLIDGSPPKYPGTFHVIWAGDSMYFAIHCQDPDTSKLKVSGSYHDDAALWDGDVIELLIETQLNSYYQIAINPAGTIIDLDRNRGDFDMLWTSHIEVATHIGEGYWNAEVRIPVVGKNQFEVDPRNGLAGRCPSATYPWYFNVCRQRIRPEGNDLTAYWPTGKTDFHDVSKFSALLVK